MLRYRRRHLAAGGGGMNMTPMIDVTFLLLTFFMLASHFASAEKVAVELPRPDANQAVEQRFPEKIIINMRHVGPGEPPALMIGPVPMESLLMLSDRLEGLAAIDADVQVILRADRRLAYGDVRDVMELIRANGFERLQVVVELDGGRTSQ